MGGGLVLPGEDASYLEEEGGGGCLCLIMWNMEDALGEAAGWEERRL